MKAFYWVVALGMGATVQAADYIDAPQRMIQLADLNLADKSGIAIAYARIERAASSVCELQNSHALAQKEKIKSCEAKAIDDAVQQMHSVKLAAYHVQKKQGAG